MDNASIPDIMWNLKSAFQEATFQGAEIELVKREQKLKSEIAATKVKYDTVLRENNTLKRQLDQLRRQRGGFKDQDKVRWLEEEKDEVAGKFRVLEEERGKKLKKIGVLEAEKTEAVEKEKAPMDKVRVLEMEKAEAMEKVRVLEMENAEAMEKVRVLKKEKADAIEKVLLLEREKKEARVEKEEILEKVRVLAKEKEEMEERIVCLEREKEKVAMEAEMEKEEILEKVRVLAKEKEKTEERIVCLVREKEKVAMEAEMEKKIVLQCKERINSLTKVPKQILSGSGGMLDGVHTDAVDNLDLDTNIKEDYNSQDPVQPPKLSGLSACKPARAATTPIIYISESDDEGVHSPNGVKRKRDSFGTSNSRLADKGSAYDQSPSRSIEAGKCSDEELTSDAQWQFEADMLNAFEEHPVLTMEAVCALYRHQKSCGLGYGLGLSRNRGFDAIHASRGMALAEFLLDGNPHSKMKKTTEELKLHDPKGLDDCKTIASANSEKLFVIYQMEEDPYFGLE